MKKVEKVNTIKAWLANSEYHKTQQSGIPDKDHKATDNVDVDSAESVDSDVSDHEDDVVLLQFGSSSEDYGSNRLKE